MQSASAIVGDLLSFNTILYKGLSALRGYIFKQNVKCHMNIGRDLRRNNDTIDKKKHIKKNTEVKILKIRKDASGYTQYLIVNEEKTLEGWTFAKNVTCKAQNSKVKKFRLRKECTEEKKFIQNVYLENDDVVDVLSVEGKLYEISSKHKKTAEKTPETTGKKTADKTAKKILDKLKSPKKNCKIEGQKVNDNIEIGDSIGKKSTIYPVYGSILTLPELCNYILVDAAGSAFKGKNKTYSGAGISGAIYDMFTIKKNPMRDQKHGFEFKNKNLTTEVWWNKHIDDVEGIIHAIGPNSSSADDKFYSDIEETIKNIGKVMNKNTTNKNIALPLLSTGVYKPSDLNLKEYMKKYVDFIEKHLQGYTVYLNCYSKQVKDAIEKLYKISKPTNTKKKSKVSPTNIRVATFNIFNFYKFGWKMGKKDKKHRSYDAQMRCIEKVNPDMIALQEAAFVGGFPTSYVDEDGFISRMEEMDYEVYINGYYNGNLNNVLAIKKHMKPEIISQHKIGGTNIAKVKGANGKEVYIVSIHLNLNSNKAEKELRRILKRVNNYENVIMLGDFNHEKDELKRMGMPDEFESYSTKRETGLKRMLTIDHVWFKGDIKPEKLPKEKDTHSHTFHKIKDCDSSDHLGVQQAFSF